MGIGVIDGLLKDWELLASGASSSGDAFEVYREAGTTHFILRRNGAEDTVFRANSWRQLLELLYGPEVPSGVMTELAWKLFTQGVCKAV